MAEGQSPNRRLDSWKNIAAYLGRDVRTVIRWELTRGLPVRRLPGLKRSAVYAFRDEIDAWLRNQDAKLDLQPLENGHPKATFEAATASEQSTGETASQTSEAGNESYPRWAFATLRPQNLWPGALGLAILLVVVGLGVARSTRIPLVASRLAFTSDSLQAWDDANHLVWEHRFPDPFANTLTVRDINPLTGHYMDPASVNRASLHDLFGDGRQEALAITVFPADGSVADVQRQILWCLGPDGKVLWSYEPRNTISFGARQYAPPWQLSSFVLSDEPGPKTIWIVVSAFQWGKSFIARLDAHGHPSMQFINSGETATIQRFHTSAGPMLWIGGFNDEYDTASLAIMPDTQKYAVSPQTPNSGYACIGCGTESPLDYIVFPRYEISKTLHLPNNKIFGLNGNSLGQVEVRQQEVSADDQLLYDFQNPLDLTQVSVHPSATFWRSHLELERQGKIRHSVNQCPDRIHPPPLRLYRDGVWSEVPLRF